MKPAAQLAAMRQTAPKVCRMCGKSFTALTRARYCSAACRAKHWRQENRNRNMDQFNYYQFAPGQQPRATFGNVYRQMLLGDD